MSSTDPGQRLVPISLKLVLPIIATIFLANTAIVAAQYLNNKRINTIQSQNAGSVLLDIIEETLVVSPELFGSKKLDDMLLRFAQATPGIDRIQIVDPSLKLVADSDRTGNHGPADEPFLAQVLESEREFTIDHPHNGQPGFLIVKPLVGAYNPEFRSSVIGVAAIEISSVAIQQELNFSLFLIFTMILITGLVTGLGIYFLLRRYILLPLKDLSFASHEFAQGNLAHRIKFRSSDELGELSTALNRMSDDLSQNIRKREEAEQTLLRQERLAAVGQVTATVSHELRNPLGAIRSATDALRKFSNETNPRFDRALNLLERSQVRCDKVITDLLNFTRVQQLNLKPTPVDEWVAGILEDCNVPDEIQMSSTLGSGIELSLDRDRLDRAIRNVIDNACQAMLDETGTGGQLAIVARVADERLELSFKDTGKGISPEEQARIFEPLYSTKAIGVGLGLPLVKQVMEQHKGGIEVKSEAGNGAEIILWLPLTQDPTEAV